MLATFDARSDTLRRFFWRLPCLMSFYLLPSVLCDRTLPNGRVSA